MNLLESYIRINNGSAGYMCAVVHNNCIRVGVSVNRHHSWQPTKNEAYNNMLKNEYPDIPIINEDEVYRFINLCKKKFKGKKFAGWVYDFVNEYVLAKTLKLVE